MFDLSRETLDAHSADVRQFIDCRHSVLQNGMRIAEVYNSSGLTFTLLPDRGFDIWTAHYRGIPLTWISRGSPHTADYGSPWLRQFNGGLLTTCGMQHSGPPELDDETGERRGLHGNFTRLRAELLRSEGYWEGDAYGLEIRGSLSEASLFGEQIHLERTFRVTLGVPGVEILDIVSNVSDTPTPFMLLYHFNVGYPLVRQDAKLDVPVSMTFPRDKAAERGLDTWPTYDSAQTGYEEQVFYHHVRQANSMSRVLLSNGDIGLLLAWDTRHAPYVSQWKNFRRGMYVCGIEPGNCVPEGLNAARTSGRLVTLQPGESHRFTNTLQVIDGAETIARSVAEIEDLRATGAPAEGFRWKP
jgi:hypothetical protein